MDINQLRQYMDFYKSNVRDPNNWPGKTGGAFEPTSFDFGGQALDWATQQLNGGYGGSGGQRADFFGEPRNAFTYAAPDRFNDPMPARQPTDDPMRPMIRNYIARMLGGR